MQSYPQWKIYFSIGLVVFIVCGAVFVYFDAKDKKERLAKIGQMERDLEVAKKEKEKQESLTRDATDRAHSLTEQLNMKTEELTKVLKDKPQIDGEIGQVRIFPWQYASASRKDKKDTEDMVTTTGVLVFARVRNHGSDTTLAHWELSIELPDNTVMKPQKWPVQKKMRIACADSPINISKDEYLDAQSKQALHKTGERSGVTVWMVKDVPPSMIWTKDSVYTLTARDTSGMVHALESYTLAALPQKCFGFDVLD